MKVSALIFLCSVAVTFAVAIPIQPENAAEAQLTLADLENEQKALNYAEALTDENSQNLNARDKRFITLFHKKLALAKLAHLGIGWVDDAFAIDLLFIFPDDLTFHAFRLILFSSDRALGIAGAALATKGVLRTVLDFPSALSPGFSYTARASPRLSVSYPNGAYLLNQYYR